MRHGPAAALVAAAVLLLHGLLAWRVPVPGAFLKYTLAAEQLLAGALPAERLLDFSPLYLWLAVAAQRLGDAAAILGVLQLVLVAGAAAFADAVFRRRFPAWLAAAAVAVFAVDRHVLVYERILEPEAVLLFSLLGFLWAIGRRSALAASALMAGVFAAFCLLTRPTFLPVFVLVPLALWLERGEHWRRRALLFSVPVLLALLGLTARTAVWTGDPRTPVMNPGTVFFEGNNPLSQGVMARYPPTVLTLMGRDQSPDSGHAVYRRVARAATGEDLSIRQVNAYWSGLAWASVRAEPLAALGRVRDKLLLAFHGYRWHDISLAWQLDRALPPLSLPFAFVAALALPGFLLEARRFRECLALYLVAGAQLGVMLVFYVSARHRVVLLPVLLYFAAATVEYLRAAERKWPVAVLAVVLAVVLLLPDDKMRDEEYQRDGHTALSVLLPELRQRTRAEPLAWHADLATEALASAPFWLDDMRPVFFPQDDATLEERLAAVLTQRRDGFSVDFDLGIVLLEAGRPAAAAEVFEGLLGREPSRGSRQASAPLFYLARATVLSGQRERGREMLDDALERWPGHPYVLAELRVLTGEQRYEDVLEATMGLLDARYLLAQADLVHGRPAEAAEAFAFVAQRLPELREAGIGLAVALGQQGQLDEAAERYLAVAYERPQPLLHSRDVAEIFRRWAAAHPEDARTRFLAGRVLFQHGRYREALELLRGLDEPRASAEAARIERAWAR